MAFSDMRDFESIIHMGWGYCGLFIDLDVGHVF